MIASWKISSYKLEYDFSIVTVDSLFFLSDQYQIPTYKWITTIEVLVVYLFTYNLIYFCMIACTLAVIIIMLNHKHSK